MNNIRTLLNEIRSDIDNYNFNYHEYTSNTLQWDRTFIIDGQWIIYHYIDMQDHEGSFIGRILKNEFINNKNEYIIKHIANSFYYNYNYNEGDDLE